MDRWTKKVKKKERRIYIYIYIYIYVYIHIQQPSANPATALWEADRKLKTLDRKRPEMSGKSTKIDPKSLKNHGKWVLGVTRGGAKLLYTGTWGLPGGALGPPGGALGPTRCPSEKKTPTCCSSPPPSQNGTSFFGRKSIKTCSFKSAAPL